MAEKSAKPGYAGKISNKGAQVVEAVYAQSPPKKGKVTKGGDLRVKGGK